MSGSTKRSRKDSKQPNTSADEFVDIVGMESKLKRFKKSLPDLADEAGVGRTTVYGLKENPYVKASTAQNIREGFARLTGMQSQFIVEPGSMSLPSFIPDHPEYLFVDNSPLNRKVRTQTGIDFYQFELRHRTLETVRARGKIYGLYDAMEQDRIDCFHHVERHSKVCRSLASHSSILRNLSAISFPKHQGMYIVDEWFDGELLADCTSTVKTWPIRERMTLIAQILEAIRFVHSKRTIIRTLELSTILIDCTLRTFKLTHFELAKILDSKSVSKDKAWRNNMCLAPEILNHNQTLPTCDIFSVGVIARELFEPELESQGTASELAKFIQKSTATLPSKRYQTAEEALSSWKKILSNRRERQ